MPQPGPTHVLIVHEEALTCAGCIAVLGPRPDLPAAACGLGEAVALVAGERPGRCDVIVADYASALALALTARQAARRHAARCPRILVLTAMDREWDVRAAMEAGVHGYLLQRCRPEQLVEAIEAVARDVPFVSVELAPKLARSLTQDRLTRREMDVLLAMSTGASNKDISLRLGITDATVKTHVRAILSKVGAGARTEAVAIAARRGLTARPPLEAIRAAHFGQKAPVLIQASTSSPN
ncbi:response regulator transcription factor [Mitsuaria sp. GD03876]|uniref:response regulator transcription factor n=1 Tax=Mitsuaria sp. GD03876 TaxID=2975399 RepID=UPI0024481426|nr:response regulator transcription factor [Mitsuaria sp. GD03876]MDH0867526.1 response regulator transcription factor [Mitsuaria sp. GD03876]